MRCQSRPNNNPVDWSIDITVSNNLPVDIISIQHTSDVDFRLHQQNYPCGYIMVSSYPTKKVIMTMWFSDVRGLMGQA